MSRKEEQQEQRRVIAAGLAMLAGFLFLATVLWRIQVVRGAEYADDARRQSRRMVRVPAPRGRIKDRHGRGLAENEPVYSLLLNVEMYRRPGRWDRTAEAVGRELRAVSDLIGRPIEVSPSDFTNHVRRRLPLPMTAWTNLDARAVARFAENQRRFKGVEIGVDAVRIYTNGPLACHILGYVGGMDWTAEERRGFHFLMPETMGRGGLERRLNAELAGTPGRREIRVDASGFLSDKRTETAPLAGRDVRLALDIGIQRVAEAALAGRRGAMVVMDPRNGDVLALCSSPGFDPNRFSPAIPRAVWEAMQVAEAGRPLLNRAVSAIYPPGSLFKTVVALAALEYGGWDAEETVSCRGVFERGAIHIRCSSLYGHGSIRLRKAIEVSCNPYFCEMGLRIGYDPIRRMAEALGFGARTGIDLDGESAGLLPDSAWKRRRFRDGWRDGDTANISIGQGFLTATPLQMAVLASALANGGRVLRPRLILGMAVPGGGEHAPAVSARDLAWSARTRDAVRGGMRDAVASPSGTARQARIAEAAVAAKTGTAEYGVKGSGLKHAWMMAFAPYDRPRYAVVAVVEEGDSGGSTAGPLVRAVMQHLFTEAEG